MVLLAERLQKILTQVGLGSRREMERWIAAGVVKINGFTAKLGDSATAKDKITVRGRLIVNPLNTTQETRILLYHKPVGEISSKRDPRHDKTVFDHLPNIKAGRWIQVGRLDINTSGLLIFTNNGELANRLMHPRFEQEREYAVRVRGAVTSEMIQNLLKGVLLDSQLAKFNSIEYGGGNASNRWFHVVLKEGRNREVRRLWASQGMEVSRLIRVRFGDIRMPRSLRLGQHVELEREEVERFLSTVYKSC